MPVFVYESRDATGEKVSGWCGSRNGTVMVAHFTFAQSNQMSTR